MASREQAIAAQEELKATIARHADALKAADVLRHRAAGAEAESAALRANAAAAEAAGLTPEAMATLRNDLRDARVRRWPPQRGNPEGCWSSLLTDVCIARIAGCKGGGGEALPRSRTTGAGGSITQLHPVAPSRSLCSPG